MRKPRDFDAALKALGDKARILRDRKLVQLGELTVATGADALPIETLAGALLAAVESKDDVTQEGWRTSGAKFFQRAARGTASGVERSADGSTASDGGAKPPVADARAS